MQELEVAHYQAAKKILRYLSGTIDHGLFFEADSNNKFYTYADANWRRNVDTRRSISGILHKLGNSSISWSSRMQPTVSLSSTEAKYRVLIDAAKDTTYFRRLMNELRIDTQEPTQLMNDNQSCIKLVKNPVMHAKTKHIELQHYFICEAAAAGNVSINYVPTNLQQEDFLTKPLPQ